MIPLLRKEKIKKIILEKKSITVIDLAERFEVSEETIRRDLNILEDEGVIKRTHGGAVLAESVMSRFKTSDLKHIFVENKRMIANYVIPHVKPGSCIFVDSSTTAYYLAEALGEIPLTIVTNSLDTMKLLSSNPKHELIGVGGNLSKNRNCFVGSVAQRIVKNFFFDYVFLSCRTLSIESGAMDSSIEEAEIKRIAAKQTENVWLLVDHTKLDKLSFIRILGLEEVNRIVTDKPFPAEWKQYLEKTGISFFDFSDNIY